MQTTSIPAGGVKKSLKSADTFSTNKEPKMSFTPVNWIKEILVYMYTFLKNHLGHISAHTLGWITIVLMHFAAIPTLVAVLMAQSDKLPPVDLMIFVWAALTTLFFKSLIERNFLYLATICMGFLAQTVLMGFILFK
jgi:cobalamin biosynthesis protein CobD/CbiB